MMVEENYTMIYDSFEAFSVKEKGEKGKLKEPELEK